MDMHELFSDCPKVVTLVQFDDGTWSWHTEEMGATQFKTPEDALAHYRHMDEAR